MPYNAFHIFLFSTNYFENGQIISSLFVHFMAYLEKWTVREIHSQKYFYRKEFSNMAKVISLINEKGGVGKTTSTNVLAACLKHRGKRVLCVDFDQQGHLSFSMGAQTGDAPSIYDVIKHTVKASQAIQQTEVTDIIPASDLLKTLEKEFTTAGNEGLLRDALKTIAPQYDYIFIDSPPELGLLSINALVASDVVLIPCLPDGYSLRGAVQVHETICRIRQAFNPTMVVGGIFLVRYYARENLSRSASGALEQLSQSLSIPFLRTHIRHSNAIGDSTSARQQDVVEHRPKNNAVKDYQQMVDELLRRGVI